MDVFYKAFYQYGMLASLVMTAYVLVLSWQRLQFRGAQAMLALSASTFIWTIGFLLEANSQTLENQLLFNNIGYIGSQTVPVAWFVFALRYTDSVKLFRTWRRLAPLCVIPFVTVVLVWSNPWHHLMWSNERLENSGPFLVTAKTYGPFFWVALTYNYTMVLAGAVLLIRRLFTGSRLYLGQAVSLLVAVSVPLVWNIIYVFKIAPILRKDLTPLMFAISGFALVIGLMRFRLLAAIPFALRLVMNQLKDGIMVFDNYYRLLEANPAALGTIGLTRNEAIGRELSEMPLSSPILEHLVAAKLTRAEVPVTADGENRFYEIETTPMRDDFAKQIGWLTTIHDVTDRKMMMQQLIAQDRLASVGQLTAGIAHEINNPLTPMMGFSALLLEQDLPDETRVSLAAIKQGTTRIQDIVSKLLTFTRHTERHLTFCDINELIETTIQLRAYQLERDGIKVVREYAVDLPRVHAVAAQLQQVFLNIILNAEYEMKQSHGWGTLRIRTEKLGSSARISFKDDGLGIPKQNLDRLFTPFFTTKKTGEGTGLGLAICQTIVSEHNGRISAESVQGEGATFSVDLPLLPPVS